MCNVSNAFVFTSLLNPICILTGLENDSEDVGNILNGNYGLSSGAVSSCMSLYGTSIDSIPDTLVFVEPKPWPRTLRDMKGQLEVSIGNGRFRNLPIARKYWITFGWQFSVSSGGGCKSIGVCNGR